MWFSGTIIFMSGDNLGSQLVGGFKEGSGANLKCRHCLGNSDEIRLMVSTRHLPHYLMLFLQIIYCA